MAKVGKSCLAKRVKVEWLFQLLTLIAVILLMEAAFAEDVN